MKLSKIASGIVIVVVIQVLLTLQSVIGKVIVHVNTTQLIILYGSILAYYALSATERYSSFRALLVPPIVVVLADITFSNLVLHGIPYFYGQYIASRNLIIVTLFAIAAALVEYTEKPLYQAAISASCFVVAGISSYMLLNSLGLSKFALPALIAFLIFAATAFSTAYGGEIAEFIRGQRGFLIGLVFVLAAYIFFVKPLLIGRPGIANYIEWLIVAVAFYKVARDFKRRIVVDESESVALHEMRDEFLKDPYSSELDKAEKEFVERGVKTPLIVSLVMILTSAGLGSKRIAKIVSPIVSYQDEKPPRLPIPWEVRLIERRNRYMRKRIVDRIRKSLEEVR